MTACNEPGLEELLRDPVIGAVMRADRVDRAKLIAMFASVARAIDLEALRPAARPRGVGRRIARQTRGHLSPRESLCACGA